MENTTNRIPPIPPIQPEPIPTIYLDSALGIARHLLTVAAGVLVSKGLVSSEGTTQFVELGVGVLTFVITIAWSVYQKHNAKKVLVVALAAPPGTTEAEATKKASKGVDVPSVLTPPTVVPESIKKS